jgi:hypothetical protein
MRTLELTFPQGGMNATLDAQVLSTHYGAYLENFTLHKSATGRLRYGTRVLSPIENNDILIASLTQDNLTVTAVTQEPHGLNALSRVTIVGAYPLSYNVSNQRIHYIDATTFSYTVDLPLAPQTGQPRLLKDASGSHQDLEDTQTIVDFFDFKDRPLVAVQSQENYVPQVVSLNDTGTEITITNPIDAHLPFIGVGNKVSIHYTLGGQSYDHPTTIIKEDLNANVLTLTLDHGLNSASQVLSLTFSFVEFYSFEETSGHYEKVSGNERFFAFSPVRATFFKQQLIVVNGVNQPHVWDGQTLSELKAEETHPDTVVDEYTVTARNQFRCALRTSEDPFETDEIKLRFQVEGFPITQILRGDFGENETLSQVVCPLDHGLHTGDEVLLYETGNEDYDGRSFLITVLDARTFTLNDSSLLSAAGFSYSQDRPDKIQVRP